ncbi:MAG: NAD(P)H-binding protein, partial [Acidimicrobiia bacterium]|nr:NAD(P)H-binding protein [Acidimicrobiia bacterium]
MPEPGLHVVFGTGAIGLAVIDALVEAGRRVRAVNRSGRARVPQGVEVTCGDASDPGFARMAAEGASAVYQCLGPPYDRWAELFPPLQSAVISAAEAADARLVTLENLYMYRHDPAAPITEETPEEPRSRKGGLRKAMSDELRRVADEGRVEIAIGRASNYFGPRGGIMSPLGDRVVPRVLAGKNTTALGDPDLPHTYSYLPDIGRALVMLAERPEAAGHVWLLPNAE